MLRHAVGVSGIDKGGRVVLFGGSMSTAALEPGQASGAAGKSDNRVAEKDEGEGQGKGEDADEGGGGDGDETGAFESAPADANDGLEHHGKHGRLEAEEQRLDDTDLPKDDIDGAQNAERDQA